MLLHSLFVSNFSACHQLCGLQMSIMYTKYSFCARETLFWDNYYYFKLVKIYHKKYICLTSSIFRSQPYQFFDNVA